MDILIPDGTDPLINALWLVAKDEASKALMGPIYAFGNAAIKGAHLRKQRDVAIFLMELARRAQDEGIDFEKEFQGQVFGEEVADEVITQALKAALEVTDSGVLAALAHLAFHYKINQMPIDLFFRGFVRVMESVGASELEVLKRILLGARQVIDVTPHPDKPTVAFERLHDQAKTRVHVVQGVQTLVDTQIPPALSSILKSTGVALTPPTGRFNVVPGEFYLDYQTLKMMFTILL